MLFNSLEFLFIFLPVVLILYYTLIKLKLYKYTNVLLLIASLYFYSYYKVEYLKIIVASILFNYICGYFIQKDYKTLYRKLLVAFAVVGNLGLLCYFKYFNFIMETLNNLSLTHFNTMKLLLPLGISFFTFQQISYITDLYKKEAEHTNLINYALFVSFFPQLIAGPICVYKELAPQFNDLAKKVICRENIYRGIFFITIGLCKKTLLADNFAYFIEDVVSQGLMTDFYTTWIFAFASAIQGYFDFSGYCDMALGIAILFNIQIPINFDSPYKSKDISDFWRRWHITMGRFMKYNVYIPMGGSRRGTLRTYWNLFFIFMIIGVWHGANWPCILYGTINGVLVCINKFWKKFNIVMNDYLAIFITFMTLVFLAPLVKYQYAYQYWLSVKSMLGFGTFYPVGIENFNFVFYNSSLKLNVILFIISFIIIFCFKNSNELVVKYVEKNNVFYNIIICVIFVVSALSITKGSEFIYFNF